MQELVGKTVIAVFHELCDNRPSGYRKVEYKGNVARVSGNMVLLKNVKFLEEGYGNNERKHDDMEINTLCLHFVRFDIVQ